MKKTVFISLFAALCGGTPHAQQLSGDSLASDFRILVRYVEETHPDPYSAFGGKVFFHREAFDAEQRLRRVGRATPVENLYGAYRALSNAIPAHRPASRLIQPLGGSVAVELETANGRPIEITLDYLGPEDYSAVPKAERPVWSAIDESRYMSYAFLDEGRRAMLEEMKAACAPTLIIDLRDNGGGWTPVAYATLYELYGDRYLETDMGTEFCKMVSPLLMRKMGTTLGEFNAARGTSYRYGDYIFDAGGADTRTTPEKRREFVDGIFGGDAGPVADLGGEAVYTPERVFVVTNEGTFSAAFHYAFFLWRMGATVVGVPSSQAPNTFMETTEFTLPYTGLRGSVSNSAQMFLPAGDPRAKVFLPEITLSPGDLRGYGFDKHADILYLMDRLELKTYLN